MHRIDGGIIVCDAPTVRTREEAREGSEGRLGTGSEQRARSEAP